MKTILPLLLLSVLLIQCNREVQKEIVVTGRLIDRPYTDTLNVLKSFQDWRFEGRKIAVSDSGTFRFTIPSRPILEYKVIFQDELRNGAWNPVSFYNDAPSIKMELYPQNRFDENKIIGSPLTNNKQDLEKKLIDEMMPYYSSLQQKISALASKDQMQSPEGAKLKARMDSLARAFAQDKLDFIMTDRNPMKYRMLLDLIENRRRYTLEKDSLLGYQKIYAEEFPTHPYTEKAQFLFDELKAGDRFIDFKVNDDKGSSLFLSDKVNNNQIVLLDLWAPWCHPCILKSKKVIPLYEEYHEMGFEVVAVIGGISDAEKFERIRKKYAYPWKCYSEINNRNKLWEEYDIERSGGGQFLISKDGSILAINPEEDELENYLKELK